MTRTPTAPEASDVGEWLTSEQVMERLLEDPRLRRAASTCVLPAVRCGDEWRFRRSDLDQWIGRQTRSGFDMNGANPSRAEA